MLVRSLGLLACRLWLSTCSLWALASLLGLLPPNSGLSIRFLGLLTRSL
jgi:hypothetical protein